MNLNEIKQELLTSLNKIDRELDYASQYKDRAALLSARTATLTTLANIQMSKPDEVIDESLISAFDDVNLFEPDDSNGKIDPTKYLPKGKRL